MCLNNNFQCLNTKTRTSMKPNQHLMPLPPHPLPHPTLTLSLNHHHLFSHFCHPYIFLLPLPYAFLHSLGLSHILILLLHHCLPHPHYFRGPTMFYLNSLPLYLYLQPYQILLSQKPHKTSFLNLNPLTMEVVRGCFVSMQNFFLSFLMGGGLIRMSYMRHIGMLKALFGLDVRAQSGSLLVSQIYETGCLVVMYSIRDSGKMEVYRVLWEIKQSRVFCGYCGRFWRDQKRLYNDTSKL